MVRPQESASGAGLLAPFHEIVWYLILVSLIVVGPVIYCVIVIYQKIVRCQDPDQPFYSLPHCVWFVYGKFRLEASRTFTEISLFFLGGLMKQGSTLSPKSDSIRMIFATWWIFITVLTSFYTANLTAFLTLAKFSLPINNPKDISSKRQPFISQKGFAFEYAIINVS